MKFSLKTLVAAVALAAASGAHADIQNGQTGNGELFFNIWDANGSYTRGLGTPISDRTTPATLTGFETLLAAASNIDLSWTADSTFTSFLLSGTGSNPTVGGIRSGTLNWNIVANDTSGANRLLTTFTAPAQTSTRPDNEIKSGATAVTSFINQVNPLITGTTTFTGQSLAVDSGSSAYAGNAATFGKDIATFLNFDNIGTVANNSFASGLGFMRIDTLASGTEPSVYNPYYDPSNNLVTSITNPVGGNVVRAYLDTNNTLHIQAVPEPETYAMLLAGLGMLGFMARRRLNNRV